MCSMFISTGDRRPFAGNEVKVAARYGAIGAGDDVIGPTPNRAIMVKDCIGPSSGDGPRITVRLVVHPTGHSRTGGSDIIGAAADSGIDVLGPVAAPAPHGGVFGIAHIGVVIAGLVVTAPAHSAIIITDLVAGIKVGIVGF